MVRQKYRCIVCGKEFTEGQGIVMQRGSIKLTFHSNKCASSFFKMLIERPEASCLESSIKDVIKDFEKKLEEKEKKNKKVIA
ncbi:MAG: hypothetical protein ACP5I6_01015 [Caldisphaera sp.]|jgi:ribosomal protein L24E|nr:hypothetical protein [Caldisphaera sp.]PMP59437.1 MAG: hypothetical protein C0201_04915 [Caldisphaera sp.]